MIEIGRDADCHQIGSRLLGALGSINLFPDHIYRSRPLLIQRAGKENEYYMIAEDGWILLIAEYGMESLFACKIIQIERIGQIE